ncbi:homeobox-domain-containing protein, partial [Neoconidiobolus thromboides FSU 785]
RKRTRANADQLSILEEAFSHNSSPNSRAREILAEKVNMSERSVQIWFQNRRAKVKLMQKPTIQPRSLSLGSISSPFLGSVNKQNDPNSIMGEIRCDVLSIGSWRRRTVQKGDLQCIYNLSQRVLTWHIADGGMKFKMEIPFSAIVSITIKPIDDGYNQANAIFDTNQVPSFFMEANVQGQLMWAPCNDFTENMQATRFFKHTLYGP